MLLESVYAMDFFKLSKIIRPFSMPFTMLAKLSSNKIMSAVSLANVGFLQRRLDTMPPRSCTADTINNFCCGDVRKLDIFFI